MKLSYYPPCVLFFLIFLLYLPLSGHSCAITNGIEQWRRLGDNILTYCKTKYYAKKFNLPVFLTPFPYSSDFELHFEETILTDSIIKKFTKTVIVYKEEDIKIDSEEPILFVCPFLAQTPWLYTYSRENIDFEKEIKQLLTPLIEIKELPKPDNVVTVAVHVRKGGGYDKPLFSRQQYENVTTPIGFYLYKNNKNNSCTDVWQLPAAINSDYCEKTQEYLFKKTHYSDYIWPTKFPTDQYYLDQIKNLYNALPEKNILIYLFTDDPNPEAIVEQYMHALKKYPRIIFSYRKLDNSHSKNVINDLFLMIQCESIISANSSFAQVAHILGNHSLIFFPAHALVLDDKIVIDKAGFITVKNPHNNATRTVTYKEILYKNMP